MTNAQVGRAAALGLVAVSCAALAACSSPPPPGREAQSTRASAMAAAKTAHADLSSVSIAYNASIAGRLFSCGTYQKSPAGNGPNALQYTASMDWTLVKKGSVPLAVLGRDVVQKLDGAGWRLRSAPSPNQQHPAAATYIGERNGLNMQVLEINDNPGFGALVTVFINASCFDAGSESTSTKFTETYDENVDEPSPFSTPSATPTG